jgi:hypothetical protein
MADAEWQSFIDGSLSVAAQVSQFVGYVVEQENIAKQINERILGRFVDVKTFVDGTLDKVENIRSLASIVTVQFQIAENVLAFVAKELEKQSPYKSGNYVRGNVLFADGILIDDISKAPSASEFMFVNIVPYALKIESGESPMAPNGVYEVVAQIAKNQFPNSRIEFFDYVGAFGVMAQTQNSKYGKHTTLQMNKSQNRFPAIRVIM